MLLGILFTGHIKILQGIYGKYIPIFFSENRVWDKWLLPMALLIGSSRSRMKPQLQMPSAAPWVTQP